MSFIFEEATPRTPAARFWRRTKKVEGGCWEWLGLKNAAGYGTLAVKNKKTLAHRFSLTLHGVDVDGKYACHHCDNKGCVNPEHLYAGDRKSNARDAVVRGRYVRGADHHWAGKHKGETNGRAKLSAADVLSIRERVSGGELRSKLAREFQVSWTAINYAVNGQNWGSL